jgi:hypothetical protein
MSLENRSVENKSKETGVHLPSQSLLSLIDDELQKTEEFYRNLSTEYDEVIYTSLEDKFNELRKRFKNKSQVVSDIDYAYINHTTMRREAMEKILICATEVAGRFQDARKNRSLDRPKCKDALENLINAMKSFKHIIEEQSKI